VEDRNNIYRAYLNPSDVIVSGEVPTGRALSFMIMLSKTRVENSMLLVQSDWSVTGPEYHDCAVDRRGYRGLMSLVALELTNELAR
jgi:hypothetical protein